MFQVEDDLKNGVANAVIIPSDEAGKQEVIAALVANVEGMIKSDRKITSLKQLQVKLIYYYCFYQENLFQFIQSC